MGAETIKLEFNYASLTLKPYSGKESTSNHLLKSIIQKLNDASFPSDKKIIDRHMNRKGGIPRKLVMISNQFTKGGTRCFGRIALIKNKVPLVWLKSKDVIEELEREENKNFIEVTNYVIDFGGSGEPILMHEFNSEGPRLSDIEYYIRHIASQFKIAKSIKCILHLQTNYQELEKDIRNIFGVTVKVKSAYVNQHSWLKELKELNDESGYKEIRLEFFFRREKESNGKFKKNIKGLDFARTLLGWIRKTPSNLAYIDDLKMKYQVGEDENIYDLDFLRNKAVSVVSIPLTEGKLYKTDDYKSVVGEEFGYYLSTGLTNN